MPHATRRECADSSSTVRRRYFAGAQRGGLDIAELEWPPGDAETEWLVRWRSAAQLARASMQVIITYVLLAEGWVPWTVATESALIPAWWGLWAARSLAGGDIIARMLDGALCGLFTSDRDPALAATRVRQGGGELYLLAQYGGMVLRDGRGSRRGGPRCVNDTRGRRARQTAALRDDSALVVLPFVEARPISAVYAIEMRRLAASCQEPGALVDLLRCDDAQMRDFRDMCPP